MSSLTMADRRHLENLFRMASGIVLDFSDRTFGEIVSETVGLNIHDEKYVAVGTSKAKKLRTFWKLEADYPVGKLLLALIDYDTSLNSDQTAESKALADQCRQIATRLLTGGPRLNPLKEHAKLLNANHLAEQIRRLEASVETDPSLAIGTAKELIETCCKTILEERGIEIKSGWEMQELTKQTFKELKLNPDAIQSTSKGYEIIKVLLNSLGTVCHKMNELRNLYGTGHGKHGTYSGLSARHAKLAVGASSTLAIFLFETHKDFPKGQP